MSAYPEEHQKSIPTRTSALLFRLKTHVLQTDRFLRNMADKSHLAHPSGAIDAGIDVLGESTTPLWTESDPAERLLQLGKVENLRVALRKLNGVTVPAHQIFSFWAQVGLPVRSRGFVEGRELREGCIVPNVAGGLCQLSNALYDAALKSNFEIVERHAHSEVIPGSVAEQNRDATIFWNYVDLRFRSSEQFQVEAFMTAENLVVRFRGKVNQKSAPVPVMPEKRLLAILPALEHELNSCMSCGVADCFRSPKVLPLTQASKTAFMVDDYWPEFDRYITETKSSLDSLFLPIDGQKAGKSNYAWSTDKFASVKQQIVFTAMRSAVSRSLAKQGASRQIVLLSQQKKLADAYASSLDYTTTHLVVSQGLLPFLWNLGVLGGRTYDVLMTSLPLSKLHERLDGARAMHIGSTTLGDFRAGDSLVDSESKALRQANRIITPHTEIASLFGERALLLDWKVPFTASSESKNLKTKVIFPASTLGRKGAYEMREAARRLNLRVTLVGSLLEDPEFWQGVEIEQISGDDWLDQAKVVVLPAWLESQPRRLLRAVAQGVPVIATRACGLESIPQVTTLKNGDVNALCEALKQILENDATTDPLVSANGVS
ncbi:MAG TPA: VanW family protein [Drouetiella sp.]